MNNKKRKISIDRYDAAFLVIAALSVIGMLYFGSLKEGYHMDEVYSYGLANSEYLPFMHFGYHDYNVKDWMKEYGPGESMGDLFRSLKKDFAILKEHGFRLRETEIYEQYLRAQANSADTRTTTWMTGQDYQDYLAATGSSRFNYASVYYNQRGDVHPPLYYSLLHTVCSFFPGVFSKWFGIVLNMAVLVLAMALLYRMVRGYLGGGMVAVVTAACYGFSCSIISAAMLVRMYALLTLFVMAACMLHVKLAQEDYCLRGPNRRWLVLITLLGFLTHYYFVVYAVMLTAVTSVCMAARKKWRAVLGYWVTLAATAVAGVCVWPFVIRHVFQGYRGRDALSSLKFGEAFWIRSKVMFGYAADQALGGQKWLMWLAAIAAAAGLALLLWQGRGRIPQSRKSVVEKACIVIFPVIIYWLLVSQMVPFMSDRYVACLYPFLCLFAVEGIYLIGRMIGTLPALRKYKAVFQKVVPAVGGVVVVLLSNFFHATPSNLYTDGQESYAVEAGTDCVYVMPDGSWNHAAQDTPILAKCRNVAVVYEENVPEICASYQYRSGDVVLVAVQNELETEPVLDQVKACMGLAQLTELDRREGPEAVWIWLGD